MYELADTNKPADRCLMPKNLRGLIMVADTFEENTLTLRNLLTNATSQHLASINRSALLFSGGLDSSVLAVLLTTLDPDEIPLIVAGTSSAKDIHAARTAAKTLGLDIEVCFFTHDEVKLALPDILSTSCNTDVLQVSLAIPLYFAAALAHELGITQLFS